MGLLSGIGKFLGKAVNVVAPFLLPGAPVAKGLISSLLGASQKAKQIASVHNKVLGYTPQEWTRGGVTKFGNADPLEGWTPVIRATATDVKSSTPTGSQPTTPTTTTPTTVAGTVAGRVPYSGASNKRRRERKVQGGS